MHLRAASDRGRVAFSDMSIKSLPSLAHALSVAPDLDAALVALGEALAESDRSAIVSVFRYDGRRDMLRERLTPVAERVVRSTVDTTVDHLPPAARPTPCALSRAANCGVFAQVT